MSKKQRTYLSLFSGCGGFDLGFKHRLTCLGAYDINPAMVNVHSSNLKTPTYVHDLNSLELPGNLPSNVDVVISGSPCQGFSTIGKRIVNDPRNHLLLVGGKIAVKHNAKVLVCENVPGSNSGEHKKYWEQLIKFLQGSGYETKLVKYNASDFGIPQMRKRLILYAWLPDFAEFVELPINVKRISLKVALSNLNGKQNHNIESISCAADLLIANKIAQGQKLCNVRGGSRSVHTWQIPEVFGDTTQQEQELLTTVMKLRRQIRRRDFGDADPVELEELKKRFNGSTIRLVKSLIKKEYLKEIDNRYVDLTNTFNGKFKRLDLNALSPTVDTKFGSYKHYVHPIENRSISVREAARIQGFPDEFVFHGSIQKQYEMIGNAVPPPLAAYIAETVEKMFK